MGRDMASKHRVLITEDDEPIRRALVDKFTKEGYEALGAEDGEKGLATALAEHPMVILLDLLMPRMDGMTMLKRLREDDWGKDVPVIILTNSSSGDDVGEALKYGVYDFLVKTDWRLEDVVERVKARIAKKEAEEEAEEREKQQGTH